MLVDTARCIVQRCHYH